MTTPISSTAVEVTPRTSGEAYRRRLQRGGHDFKVPVPKYRHARPSAPWPWMDFDYDTHDVQGERLDNSKWNQYPQNLFKNWTNRQVERSQMLTKCSDCDESIVYKIRVDNSPQPLETRTVRKNDANDLQNYWKELGESPPQDMRVQAFFVEDMTLPLLQMLGTRYTIEPFFFASSVNWIPSRYQEAPNQLGDHITVILPFMRILKATQPPIKRTRLISTPTITPAEFDEVLEVKLYMEETQTIDAKAALRLPENKFLIQDQLSLHMVRDTPSTIISYHRSSQGTSAKLLQSLMQRMGKSVYWTKILESSRDSTLFFLVMLWYPLYAWDEAFEVLLLHIGHLEHKVLKSNDLGLARELHELRERLLGYEQLLLDFLHSIRFVRDTPNPAMNDPSISEEARKNSAKLLHTEADTLISEVERLSSLRQMMFDRVANVIRLTFATANIRESKDSQYLAEVAMNDSSAMKRIAYLSMVFLPATFLANVFSMNIREMVGPGSDPSHRPTETLAHYIEAACCLTFFASWLVIALQKESSFHREGSSILRRMLWPYYYTLEATSIPPEWHESTDYHSPQSFNH